MCTLEFALALFCRQQLAAAAEDPILYLLNHTASAYNGGAALCVCVKYHPPSSMDYMFPFWCIANGDSP